MGYAGDASSGVPRVLNGAEGGSRPHLPSGPPTKMNFKFFVRKLVFKYIYTFGTGIHLGPYPKIKISSLEQTQVFVLNFVLVSFECVPYKPYLFKTQNTFLEARYFNFPGDLRHVRNDV